MKPYQRHGKEMPRLRSAPFSRRQFLARSAMLPVGAALVSAKVAAQITPPPSAASALAAGSPGIGTATSFRIAGRERFLAAGSMDYFRCPSTEWRDRILKAKRAGLNTIMTYVAWNQHEPEEGRFVFTGRSDIAGFLRLCGELQMLAIVRPGPFICDEFEMGGHPAWLLARPGLVLRAPSPVAEPYIERWFARLCAELAPLQTTHGGPLAMVQVENEFYYSERPNGLAYLQFLADALRRNGIDVPLTACGNGSELQLPGLCETINGYSRDTPTNFRKTHGDTPLLISEHYTDWMDVWTWPQTDYPKRPMLEQVSLDALSQRTMLSYFCFHGGTNFGFNGASTWKTDHSWVTTRYWAQGPVAEGGALNPNYFAAKRASLPVAQFENFFAASREVPLPVAFEGPVTGRALAAREGTLVFVLPRHPITADQRFLTDDEQKPVTMVEERPSAEYEATPGTMVLPGGERVPLSAGSVRALMLPFAFTAAPTCRIDHSNAALLGVGGRPERPVLLVCGDSGRTGDLSVNGVRRRFTFPAGAPLQLSIGGVTVIALHQEAADRTWFADGRVIVGPAFAGERNSSAPPRHLCLLDEKTSSVLLIDADGQITRPALPADTPLDPLPPQLAWRPVALAEPRSGAEGWQAIGRLRSVEELGALYGYCWYRATLPPASGERSRLLFTAAADRAHVWVDGGYAGVYGRGLGAERDLLPVALPAAAHTVTLLLDNMGRWSEGSTQQRKGILGPVYAGAEHLPLPPPALVPGSVPAETSWQFHKFRADAGPLARAWSAEWTLPAQSGRGLFVALRACPQYAWLAWNGKPLAEHHGDNSLLDGFGASEYVLPAGDGPTRLRILFYGTVPDLARSVQVYRFEQAGELRDWHFRPWTLPQPSPAAGETPRPHEPCWWQTPLDRPALPPPLFLATDGLSKGQVYLNGEPVGRFWEAGPQFSVYLPPDTLREHNTLAVLDESGRSPSETVIFRDRNVPTRSVLL